MEHGAESYRRSLQGDEGGFTELVREYKDGLTLYLATIVGDIHTAEELAEDTFVRLGFRKPHDRGTASFRTWLYRIAANKVIDARRKARPLSLPIEEMELPAAEDFAAQIQDRALLEQIENYISGLEPSEQAVFRLRIYGEKTFPEIAAALDEPEAAVKSRYYRLMGRLRKEFGADG